MENTLTEEEFQRDQSSMEIVKTNWWEGLTIHDFYIAASYCTQAEWENIALINEQSVINESNHY